MSESNVANNAKVELDPDYVKSLGFMRDMHLTINFCILFDMAVKRGTYTRTTAEHNYMLLGCALIRYSKAEFNSNQYLKEVRSWLLAEVATLKVTLREFFPEIDLKDFILPA